jgi:hypothetical protein
MTQLDEVWLTQKAAELNRWRLALGRDITGWDAYRFLKIISEQAREIRKLKTQLNRGDQ